ncbi:uncharacterized protein LOC135344945 [Halichondria panicea]|uniref:uncharacterized protein LOC135344945 n=1 Tax=Halichondria panicea TaxID=6063 RepID=UPI00312B3554
MAGSKIVFYYDVVCPFAYMTSTLVEDLARRAGATVLWRPVLLGGLYEATAAAQGREGSASSVMNSNKAVVYSQDLLRQLKRRNVPYRTLEVPIKKTLTAMRLLAAIPDNSIRAGLSHALYRAHWYEKRDLTDSSVIEDIALPFGVSSRKLLQSEDASRNLRANTSEAASRGAFGVPSLYVNNRLFHGTDRLFFVERALGVDAHPERLMSPQSTGSATLTFFFDYSSPWSFVGFERLEQLLRDVSPVNVKIEWVPFLLGALFKQIGTPNVPAVAMNEAKRNYYTQDLHDWCQYAGVKLQFPSTFPLRTVLPLRATLASNCDPTIIRTLYRAAWQDNLNIGEKDVMSSLLTGDNINLLDLANTDTVKTQLFANTSRAVEAGVCGVPSFQVNGGPLIWGQDKLNIVADMICGWTDPQPKL